jgi:hypothetical protein
MNDSLNDWLTDDGLVVFASSLFTVGRRPFLDDWREVGRNLGTSAFCCGDVALRGWVAEWPSDNTRWPLDVFWHARHTPASPLALSLIPLALFPKVYECRGRGALGVQFCRPNEGAQPSRVTSSYYI